MGAAAGAGLGARRLPAARRDAGQVRREQNEGAFGWQDSGHPSLVPFNAQLGDALCWPPPPPRIPPGMSKLTRSIA